jgi:hypothetical protein
LATAVWLFLSCAGCTQALAQSRGDTIVLDGDSPTVQIDGRLAGFEVVDYALPLAAPARVEVVLTSDHASSYFNILPPGAGEVIFIGSLRGNRFRGVLSQPGTYRIRVFLMPSAARRDESASFTLRVSALEAPAPPAADSADGPGGPDYWQVAGLSAGGSLNLRSGPSTSAAVIGRFANGTVLRNRGCAVSEGRRWCEVSARDRPERVGWVAGSFLAQSTLDEEPAGHGGDAAPGDTGLDVTGRIVCSSGRESLPGGCTFAVVRSAGGTAIVTVSRPGGGETVIHFRSGEPLRIEPAQAFTWTRDGDVTTIRVHTSEHYEVPDAVIFGG